MDEKEKWGRIRIYLKTGQELSFETPTARELYGEIRHAQRMLANRVNWKAPEEVMALSVEIDQIAAMTFEEEGYYP